jgi:hypothetical protein
MDFELSSSPLPWPPPVTLFGIVPPHPQHLEVTLPSIFLCLSLITHTFSPTNLLSLVLEQEHTKNTPTNKEKEGRGRGRSRKPRRP